MLQPKLRFKNFSNNWQEKKLGDISDVRDGTHNSPKYIKNGYPLVTSKNIQKGKIDLKNINYISLEDFEEINKRSKVSKGDILMGMIGTIGNLAIVDREDFAIKNVALIKEKKELKNRMLYQILQSNIFYKKLSLLNEGGTQKFISLNNIRNLEFNIPLLEEQKKIADFLSSVDVRIDLTSQKLELFEKYKKGVMQKFFSQDLRFKDNNGNDYPEWKEKRLEELLISRNKEKVNNTKEYQKITIKLNLKGIEKNFSEREMADTRPFYIRELNEIIIGKQNYFNGSIAIVTKEFAGCICSNAIMSFKVKKDNVKFIFYYISRRDYLKKREFLANGTGQKELSEKDFLNFVIKLPCLEEQQKIADFLSSIDNKIEKLSSKLEELKEFKKGLLQQMFA